MKPFRVLDLDNCISDDEWRIGHIRWDMLSNFLRFNDYHMLSAFDRVGNHDLVSYAGPIAVITARPEAYEVITKVWLERNGIQADALYMRPYGDRRGSVELKRDAIQRLIEARGGDASVIECCYDDRPDIIEMYRSLGLPAEVRHIHTNTTYGKPKGETI